MSSHTTESRHSLRGLQVGRVQTAVPLNVHIIAKDGIGWLLLIYEGLLAPHHIFVDPGPGYDLATRLVPPGCAIHTKWELFARAVRHHSGDALLLVDGGWLGHYQEAVETDSVNGVILTRGLRRHVPDWLSQTLSQPHTTVGGVTTASGRFTFLARTAFCDTPPLPPSVCRDVSTVLEDAPLGRDCAALKGEVTPLRVAFLDPLETVIHGRGLVPWPVPPSLHVQTPSMFVPSGRWVERRLTWKERLAVHDIPLGVTAAFPSAQSALLTGLRPIGLYRWALTTWGGLTGGVVISSISEESDEAQNGEETPLQGGATTGLESEEDDLKHRLEVIAKDKREKTATKADDAAVPVELWRTHLIVYFPRPLTEDERGNLDRLAGKLENLGLRRWRRNLWKEWRATTNRQSKEVRNKWKEIEGAGWRHNYRVWHAQRKMILKGEMDFGRELLEKIGSATWWDWAGGSVLFHWRWPPGYRRVAKSGLKVLFTGRKPTTKKRQSKERNEEQRRKIQEKVVKVLQRRYLGTGVVKSLISFFAVPKGKHDIRVVYDGTSSGLNQVIWVPRFPLPTLQRHLRQVDGSTHMADADLGEMFLNFPLHELLKELCGVDLTQHVPVEKGGRHWVRWQRAAMGLRSSPYQCTQGGQWALEMALGDRMDEGNVFRWSYVQLNLPGSTNYDPSQPWVSLRRKDGSLAAFVVLFVDDLRVMAGTERDCWLACRQVSSTFNFLRVQDAARKRRSSSQQPGAWAGGVVQIENGKVYVLVSEEKWYKTQAFVNELQTMVQGDATRLARKRLEQIRGFLGYVSQTYPIMATYLKGLHLTIDGWREGRDEEGWRLLGWENTGENEGAPEWVEAVPRLRGDIEALVELTCAPLPPMRQIRMGKQGRAIYGFGDASGRGFGTTISQGMGVEYEYGQWTTSIADETSSNWKELSNLVEAVEKWYEEGRLRGNELWLFTDNTTAENAFWKGSSRSRKLFDLVLRVKKLEMRGDFLLHVVHVSGKRMISQGTDGISRGDKSEGVMVGRSMLTYVPLHEGVLERSRGMEDFVNTIMGPLPHKVLDPAGWFSDVNQEGNFVWLPPPSCGEIIMEQLGNARHKRPNTLHVVIVPRLMTGRWRRLMGRTTDLCITLWPDPAWPLETLFEPCLLFVGLPYMSHRPLLKKTEHRVAQLRRDLSKPSLSEGDWGAKRSVLRKFLSKSRELCPLYGSMVS